LGEVEVVRHFTRLSQWNYCIDQNMYPLGSCTMKYNPKINEAMAGLHGFSEAHPLQDPKDVQGILQILHALGRSLAEISGMDAVTLAPAAGAHGEFTGLQMIRAFHRDRGSDRDKIIIPDSAHGTNPASSTLNGYRAIEIRSNTEGILDLGALDRVMDDSVAALMVTNPNTLGLFEENIVEISEMVHRRGGLVYCDGANLNALLGIAKFGDMGVDLAHINLHKTFSTPHGGGGPGAGPVCVKSHLEPFLPVPVVSKRGEEFVLDTDRPKSIGRIHGFYGNVGVLLRAYAYIRALGKEGLKRVGRSAVINANYIRKELETDFDLPFPRACMHECVFSDRKQAPHGVTAFDIAKALIDEGFHPPTIYFPLIVHGALMIEPTETETKETLDLFIRAMKKIARRAETEPDTLKQSPQKSFVTRLNETEAARHPNLQCCSIPRPDSYRTESG
jgi:glycine dehydrogenase subunit 2